MVLCSLGGHFEPLGAFSPTEELGSSSLREEPVVKSVKEMLDLDPFENEVSFLCFLV